MSETISARPRNGRGPGKAKDILATFTRNVALHGYDGTNFSDIANELGISKGTIVHHYGTKDQLLATLHESYMRKRMDEATQIVEILDDPREQLAGLLFSFVLYYELDRDPTIAFEREVMRLAQLERQDPGRALREQYVTVVRDVLRSGIAAGHFRDIDVDLHSLWMFGCTQWAYTWFDPAHGRDAISAGTTLVDFVLGSLLMDRIQLPALSSPDSRPAAVAAQCLAGAADR